MPPPSKASVLARRGPPVKKLGQLGHLVTCVILTSGPKLPPPRPASILFERPRWKGGPVICLQENLPAYENEKYAGAYYPKHFPRFGIVKMWRCEFCAKVHVIGEAPAPSGESSGKKRSKSK